MPCRYREQKPEWSFDDHCWFVMVSMWNECTSFLGQRMLEVIRHRFNINTGWAFGPFQRSKVASNIYSVHFDGIGDSAQVYHGVSCFAHSSSCKLVHLLQRRCKWHLLGWNCSSSGERELLSKCRGSRLMTASCKYDLVVFIVIHKHHLVIFVTFILKRFHRKFDI